GLRRVQPFEYHFHTPVKPHWIGRPLCQVVAADFTRLGDPAVVANMVRDGDICLSGRHADTLQPIKASDTLHARVWRSDPDVLDDAVDVVYSDDQFLAVSKPHSIPIHSNARYVHNTLVSILERQGYRDLKVTHRLDALTTGLVILARTSAAAADISLQLREGKARKMYLARVLGHMAECVPSTSLFEMFKVQRRLELGKLPVTLVECTSSFPLRINNHSPQSNTGHPQSGRFHQIRRHLAGLGHPIINDPLY
ncbi:pseudouridine synthase, partial [Blastocladiella britannica]